MTRYCRMCDELYQREVLFDSWWAILKHMWWHLRGKCYMKRHGDWRWNALSWYCVLFGCEVEYDRNGAWCTQAGGCHRPLANPAEHSFWARLRLKLTAPPFVKSPL